MFYVPKESLQVTLLTNKDFKKHCLFENCIGDGDELASKRIKAQK